MIPPLHVVTDDAILLNDDFVEKAWQVLVAGGEELAFHLRGPGCSGRVLHDLASALTARARGSGSLLLINDRVDLALALDLPGAHLGQRSLPPPEARAVLGSEKILGLSVHGALEARTGLGGCVDFFLAGTIFPTPSHPGGEVGGLERIGEVRAVSRAPVIGIGGVTPERVAGILGAGARGVAVRGGIWDADDPGAATLEYLKVLKGRGKGHADE